ncbi:MAG: hypothetical protein LAO56_10675 [Acidobacteriia bacterium]|jgi:hypothetical protein|nr:hypothetical protein [Terriglobia bacterium]
MAQLTSVLKDLEHERNRLSLQLESISRALSLLTGTSGNRATKTISAAGRARIAAAQRARWARIKREKVISISTRKGRTMSPAARKRIVAAQKARWAKWRKAQKKT